MGKIIKERQMKNLIIKNKKKSVLSLPLLLGLFYSNFGVHRQDWGRMKKLFKMVTFLAGLGIAFVFYKASTTPGNDNAGVFGLLMTLTVIVFSFWQGFKLIKKLTY